MFKRSLRSKDCKENTTKSKRSCLRKPTKLLKAQKSQDQCALDGSTLNSPIVTFKVGIEERLFAAHEDILYMSPFFAEACWGQFPAVENKKINLPDEIPEIFSCVLEYLYKGDYYPRLIHNKRKGSWELEDAAKLTSLPNSRSHESTEATIYMPSVRQHILRDTVIYCAADKYGLDDLKRIALRKQSLWCGVEVATVLHSARYAYSNTPDTDSRLRSHYITQIIRCRKIFQRSRTMQAEMEDGGKFFFDLFVAFCNHFDSLETRHSKSPKLI
ncbi:hypothetical protein K3495_g3375 [Podosphaera aphanis]|nr:hypothetical protein K3495_g3375 [Podosphaera aphanis]